MEQQNLESLIFRRPIAEDTAGVLELLIRCDISEYGEPDSEIEELVHEWDQINLKRDAWLVYSLDDVLLGYAAVLPLGKDFRYDFYVDPSWDSPSLGQELLARCEERGRAIVQGQDSSVKKVARLYLAHVNERDRAVADQAGFEPGRYYFQMRTDLAFAPPEPRWPPGIVERTFVADQDEQAVYELIQTAFARPGRTPPTFDQWREHMIRPDLFDAGLWFLALAGKELVGACLCFPYSSMGWVRQLGVVERWRRRGIGAALLHRAFGEFKRRGYDSVGLSVESERPDAYEFYQGVGMTPARQYDEYVKKFQNAG